jgi:anti-sigma B factor antagonist
LSTFTTPPGFHLHEALEDGRLTVALSGELDIATAPAVVRCLDGHRGTHRGPVLLDLRGLSFLDSSGLRVLIAADAYARSDGWALRILLRRSSPIRRTLEVSGLERMLPVELVEDSPAADQAAA